MFYLEKEKRERGTRGEEVEVWWRKRERCGEGDSEVEEEREWDYYRFQDTNERLKNIFDDIGMIMRCRIVLDIVFVIFWEKCEKNDDCSRIKHNNTLKKGYLLSRVYIWIVYIIRRIINICKHHQKSYVIESEKRSFLYPS